MCRSWGFSNTAISLSVIVSDIWNTFTKLGLAIIALAILAIAGEASTSTWSKPESSPPSFYSEPSPSSLRSSSVRSLISSGAATPPGAARKQCRPAPASTRQWKSLHDRQSPSNSQENAMAERRVPHARPCDLPHQGRIDPYRHDRRGRRIRRRCVGRRCARMGTVHSRVLQWLARLARTNHVGSPATWRASCTSDRRSHHRWPNSQVALLDAIEMDAHLSFTLTKFVDEDMRKQQNRVAS